MLRVLAYAMRGIAPPEEVEKWGSKFTMHPVGTGPYKVAEIKPKQKLVLERFEGGQAFIRKGYGWSGDIRR
ncbi:MAG: hypothetical protein JRH06_14425 [Deltaproteobacteria bacterium]|nr:hypothetical protein [Deltaproteobacteria bacterium]MBW2138733.1 hypothetical protein [Deltaproteobacteria bacterium]